ncbi:MAG TPA: cytochrome c biogenesis protein CcdA [Candidatus Limnocylindria bacterium]|nr:cytochrome c biogenesis protein CcdA [Candidatus Limnocylindria bacterium]
MEALISSFVLGFASAASPCLLPLYPAFLAFLVGSQDGGPTRRSPALYGLLVVLGVVTALIVVGALVIALSVSLGSLLAYVVPLTTIVLVGLGLLMLAGRNPFARVASVRMPVIRQPLAQAYVYGLLFGPVALPCAGPFVVALLAISIGVAETAARLAGFVAFGLGFGLPLIGLSLVGAARAQGLARWLARNHRPLMRVSGALLIVAAFAEPLRLLLEGGSLGL